MFLVALVLWTSIFLGSYAGRGAEDQILFHERTIRQYADQWPDIDIVDYYSATTPGYHILLALPDHLFQLSRQSLRLLSSLWTVALLGLLVFAGSRRIVRSARSAPSLAAALPGLILAFPLAASIYVFSSGVWLLPDNAGWCIVLAALVLSLEQSRAASRSIGAQAFWLLTVAWVMLAAVLIRQSHLWIAAPLVAGAFLTPRIAGSTSSRRPAAPDDESLAALWNHLASRIQAPALVLAASLPALAALGYFVAKWHGLTPPRFAQQHAGSFNAATPAFSLALLALYSLFLLGFLWSTLIALWKTHRWLLIAAAVLGLALALAPVTTYKVQERMGGLWQLVLALDSHHIVIANRTSPLFILLTPLGCIFLVAWIAGVRSKTRWIYLAAFLAFIAAQTTNTNAWQRYLEPGLLILLSLMAAELWNPRAFDHPPSHSTPLGLLGSSRLGARLDPGLASQPLRWIGPIALALALALITFVQTSRAKPFDPEKEPPSLPAFLQTPAPHSR